MLIDFFLFISLVIRLMPVNLLYQLIGLIVFRKVLRAFSQIGIGVVKKKEGGRYGHPPLSFVINYF